MSDKTIKTGIEGCIIDLMPCFGNEEGGVLHMLPGGSSNPDWYAKNDILDVYASFCTTSHTLRGGHYHPILNEMFFTVSGTALWILSDFRESSPTYKKTIAFILGKETPQDPHGLPEYTQQTTGALARVTLPSGIYHAHISLSKNGFTTIALGTTPYNKDDYQYPTIDEVPEMKKILETFNIKTL